MEKEGFSSVGGVGGERAYTKVRTYQYECRIIMYFIETRAICHHPQFGHFSFEFLLVVRIAGVSIYMLQVCTSEDLFSVGFLR